MRLKFGESNPLIDMKRLSSVYCLVTNLSH